MRPRRVPHQVPARPVWSGLPACALLAALLLALLCGSALAQGEKQKVAVLDVEGVGLTKRERAALSEGLRESLLKTERFVIIDRSQLQAVLDEQALQQAVCSGEACAVRLGELLGAGRIVAGKAVKLDEGTWLVTALMVDVQTSETLDLESVRHRGDLLSLLDEQVPQLARRLAGLPVEGTPAAPPAAGAPARERTLKVALFPSYLAGENAQRLDGAHDRLVAQLEKAVQGDAKLELGASFYASQAFPAAHERFRAAPEFVDVKEDAWEGLFISTPNERLVFKAGRKLGADLVFMQRSYHNPQRSGGTSYHAYLYDVNGLEVYQESGTWEPYGWTRALRASFERLVAQYRAGP